MKRRIQVIATETTRLKFRSLPPSVCPICLATDGLVTFAESATLLEADEHQVRRWIASGRTHGFNSADGQYQICKKSLPRLAQGSQQDHNLSPRRRNTK
jgi:hypothetical protein